MRTQAMGLALFTILLAATASAQRLEPKVFQNKQPAHLSMLGAKDPGETALDFLGAPSRIRFLAGAQTGADTLRVNGTSYPFAYDRFLPNGPHRSHCHVQRLIPPQSPIYLVDTAIVRTTGDTTRHLYTFDGRGLIAVDLTERWTDHQWGNLSRITSTFDADRNNLTELREYWTGTQWESSELLTSTYNADGNILTFQSERSGVNYFRNTFTYDASGNNVTFLYEQWTNNQWLNILRMNLTYDPYGNMLTGLYESWTGTEWSNYLHYAYTYDANGNRLTLLREDWASTQWVNHSHYTYTYDTNRNRLTELCEEWPDTQWVNSYRNTATYDATRNNLTFLDESWTGTEWMNNSRLSHAYDTNSRMLTELFENWMGTQWVNVRRSTYTYDANGNLALGQAEAWQSGAWALSNDYLFATDGAGNSYYWYGFEVTLSYRLLTTAIARSSNEFPRAFELAQNYPNPFNPSTAIRFELPKSSAVKLSVYDMLGRQVSVLVNEKRDAGAYEVKFDGANLASGVYFYHLSAGGFVQTRRLVLLK